MLSVRYMPMQYYDAIIIHFDGDDGCAHNIIVDGGEIYSPKYCYTDRLKKELEAIFVKGELIDLWIITHIDNDHIGGLYNFLNDIPFYEANQSRLKEVWLNYGNHSDYNVQRNGEISYKSGKALRDVLRKSGVIVSEGIKVGHSISISNAHIKVIAPSEDAYNRYIKWWNQKEFKDITSSTNGLISGVISDYNIRFEAFDLNQYNEDNEVKNNSSIAFILTYHEHNMFFTGDSCSSILLFGLEEMGLLENGNLKLDLMHIPHHGSNRNSSIELFKSIDCPLYVITGNGENRYNLPYKETIARLLSANVFECEIHFPRLTNKLKKIFLGEDIKDLKICDGANFMCE